MTEKFSINEMSMAQLNAWKELLNTVLRVQSDSVRSILQSMHTQQAADIYTAYLFEYSQKTVDNWVTIEQELLNVIFESIKEIDFPVGYTHESWKTMVNRFIDYGGNRAGNALDAHTEFYSLIFPWNDGEYEMPGLESSQLQTAENESTRKTVAEAA